MSAKKFEKLIDLIINEDQERANQLFHEIVVEKSREIYESIIEEDDIEGLEDEVSTDDDGSFDDSEDFGDEEGGEFDDEDFGDEEGEAEFGDEGDEEFGDEEGELEDRVVDLEDKLDELMAEFEAQMGGDDEEHFGDEEDMDMGDEEEFGDEDFGGEEDMGDESQLDEGAAAEFATDMHDRIKNATPEQLSKMAYEFAGEGGSRFQAELKLLKQAQAELSGSGDEVMESVQLKQVGGKNYNQFGKMGDDGQQTKSPGLQNPKRLETGGGPVKLGGNGESVPSSAKKPSNPYTKGQKEENFGNINVPGGTAGKTGYKTKAPAPKTETVKAKSPVAESKRTTKRRI